MRCEYSVKKNTCYGYLYIWEDKKLCSSDRKNYIHQICILRVFTSTKNPISRVFKKIFLHKKSRREKKRQRNTPMNSHTCKGLWVLKVSNASDEWLEMREKEK